MQKLASYQSAESKCLWSAQPQGTSIHTFFPRIWGSLGKGGRKDGVTDVFWILLDLCPCELTGAVAGFTGPSQTTFEKGEEKS